MSDPFLQRAIVLAIENASSGQGGPFAALIVKDGKIIAEAVNRVTSANDPTAHAEIEAIRQACRAIGNFQLSGCDLYASCEPCPMCLGAIYWARLDRVFYAATAADAAAAGFDDAFIYDELRRAPNARRLSITQLPHPDALRPFQAWLSSPSKKAY
jgi:guanine deaminase